MHHKLRIKKKKKSFFNSLLINGYKIWQCPWDWSQWRNTWFIWLEYLTSPDRHMTPSKDSELWWLQKQFTTFQSSARGSHCAICWDCVHGLFLLDLQAQWWCVDPLCFIPHVYEPFLLYSLCAWIPSALLRSLVGKLEFITSDHQTQTARWPNGWREPTALCSGLLGQLGWATSNKRWQKSSPR